MATSGTVGQTVITVQNLIDDGARRAGKLAEELTVEQVASARQSLFLLLSNLINRASNISLSKTGHRPAAESTGIPAPCGANDVLNALYRWMTQPSGAYTSSNGGTVANLTDHDTSTYCAQTAPNRVVHGRLWPYGPAVHRFHRHHALHRGRRFGSVELQLPVLQ
jgi:hypothetical protein